MTDRRRGLGRGLGALIPAAPQQGATQAPSARPRDVFFSSGAEDSAATAKETAASVGARATSAGEDRAGAQDAPVDDSRETSTDTQPADGPSGHDRQSGEQRPAVADAGPELQEVPGASFAEISVAAVVPNPKQPRQVFDEDDLAELTHSIKELGVLQPVVVRRSDADGDEPIFELVMGERRLRASILAGQDTIPAIIRDTSDDALLRDALLENLHRSQLNPLEEAAAYQQLLEDFSCTHEQLASRIGRSRPQISNMVRLLKLPPLVQRRVAAGVLSAGHARALLGLNDGAGMERLAQRIVAEGLSVRAVEEIVLLHDDPDDAGAADRPRKRTAAPQDPALDVAASRLADRLDTSVSITMGRRKGRLTVDFGSRDDLERILDLLGSELDPAPARD